MKQFTYLLLLISNVAFSFDPICNSPQTFTKDSITPIFKTENSTNTQNQLIIYSVNPPTPIDWSTPGKAFKSIFRNSFINEGYDVEYEDSLGNMVKRKQSIKTHFIGHMFMELKCAGYPSILTGMSSPGYEEIKGLMIDGKSFTQIISTTKGHFNTSAELQKEIDIRKEKVGNLQYMGVNLKSNSCEELLKYLTEYRACGVNQRYGGLSANPHRGEGAGCSAFALSFLQRLKVMPMIDDLTDNNFGNEFKRTIIIPKNMLKIQGKDPEVGAWGLLRGVEAKWAPNKEEGTEVTFFDPELFSKWVKEFNPEKNNSGLTYLGRDGNKLINGVWFEENQTQTDSSSFILDYLKH